MANNNGWTKWTNTAKSVLDRLAALEEGGGSSSGQIPDNLEKTLKALTAKDEDHDTRLNGIGDAVSGLSERVEAVENGYATKQSVTDEQSRATEAERVLREAVSQLQAWKQTMGDETLDEKITQITQAVDALNEGGYVGKIDTLERGLASEVQTDRNAAIQAAITVAKNELEKIYATTQSVTDETNRATQAEQALQTAINNLPTTGGTPPDEEDITRAQEGDGEVLKFKDKLYAPESFSGLGRVYLRKNIVDGKNVLTQAMVSNPNTIYVLQYDYDMNGARIEMPDGCTLEFNGGSLTNGKLVGTNTKLTGCKDNCLDGVSFGGIFQDMTVEASWLGLLPNGDGTTNGTPNQQERFNKLSQLIACTRTVTVNFRKGYYGYGGGSEGTGNFSDSGRRSSLQAMWYGYFAIELWDDFYDGYGSTRMHNHWPDTYLRTDNLTINGNNAYFLNVYPYKIGNWQKQSDGTLAASNPVPGTTVTQRTQNGGLIGIYTWKVLNLNVYNLTQDHNINILAFGGTQGASQGQTGLYFETYGNLYVEGCVFKNNVTDGISASTRGSGTNRLYPNNVVIKDTIIENCIRQGISICGGRNVMIDNCLFKRIGQIFEVGVDSGTPYSFESPFSALDIEPILEYGYAENVTVRNCKFYDINRFCIVSSLQRIKSIIITGCYAENQLIEGNVRNRTDGYHAPCLSYAHNIEVSHYNSGFTDTEMKEVGKVYETDETHYSNIMYTRFVNIRAGETVSIDNITLVNVNYGYAYCCYPPESSDLPKNFDAGDTSKTYWWLDDHDALPLQVGNVTATYKPIMKTTYKYYDFDLSAESMNYRYAYNASTGKWSWSRVNIYWPSTTYPHNDIHFYGRRAFGTLNFTVCKAFQFKGGAGHAVSTIDTLNIYIGENLNGALFNLDSGYTQYTTKINNLTIIDSAKDGKDTTVKTVIPDALALSVKNIRVIDNNNNMGIDFADTITQRVTQYGKTVRIPSYASYFVTDDGKADGTTHRDLWIGALDNRISGTTPIAPNGTYYISFDTKANYNFDVTPAPTLLRMGIVGGNEFYGIPMKALATNSYSTFNNLKTVVQNTKMKKLFAGETIFDRSRKQTIVGTGVANEYLRWDGNPYGIAEHGNYADMYNVSEDNGQSLRIGTIFTNTESQRLCVWNGFAWVDERFQTPAKRRGLSTERPGNAYSIKEGTVAPPTDKGWRIYVGYTYKHGNDIMIVESIREPAITWVDEQTFANSHKPSGRSNVTVPSDVSRSGTTAQRPTAAYAYANLYIGFEYYDTTLSRYVYIETLTSTTITWNERRKYRYWHLISNQDEGYEFYDTTLQKPIYAKTLNNDGSVEWVDATGAIV